MIVLILTKISSILTLFLSLVSSHKNLFAIPTNPLESSFHHSHFLTFTLKRILVRIKQTFRLFNVQDKVRTLHFRMRCQNFYYIVRKYWRAITCKNVFGVKILNIGPDLNLNGYHSHLSSLPSADRLVGCIWYLTLINIIHKLSPHTFENGKRSRLLHKTEREGIVLSEDKATLII